MAAPVIGTRPRVVPPKGATVDWSHPLAQGLEFCFIPAHGVVELARGYSATTGGTISDTTSTLGAGRLASTTSGYWSFAGVPDAPFLGDLSVMAVGKRNTASLNTFGWLGGKDNGSTVNNNALPFTFYISSGASVHTLQVARGGASTASTWSTSGSGPGGPYNVNLTFTMLASVPTSMASNATFWVNGESVVISPTGGASGAPTGSGRPMRIGASSQSYRSDWIFNIFAVWSRQMSHGDAAALYADPFCFLKV